ncbi:hypothetical protein BST37_08425 [Mycobacterium noviomagense]|nr:hypothetical protein BST37_08425 [Mycobacterium noviomagense]
MGVLISIIIWGTVFGTLAGLVTNSKGRGWGEGIALGAVLGIIGLIITAFLKPVPSNPPRPVTSGAPPPGWYQNGQRGLRWWNGSEWTDAAPPPSSPPPSASA